jgi:uncharacterized membrane protein
MIELTAAITVFILTHIIPAYGPLRQSLISLLGKRLYIILYSSLSIAVFIWLGFAFFNAPYIELWGQPTWTRWVPIIGMPFVCILFVGGFMATNPLSLSIGKKNFDQTRPGIIGLTRHPVMMAFALWPGLHLFPNGDVGSVLLFGLLMGLGFYGPYTIDKRNKQSLGLEEWQRLADSKGTFAGSNGWLAGIIGGGVLYVVLLWGHKMVIGVSPLP